MIAKLAQVRSFVWSLAILALVNCGVQAGYYEGRNKARDEQATQFEPMARAVISVLERVEKNREAVHGFASAK